MELDPNLAVTALSLILGSSIIVFGFVLGLKALLKGAVET